MASADRYDIKEQIGSGAAATVHRAVDTKLGRYVAIKVLRPEVAGAINRERFHREIGLLAGLRHPNIVPLLDSGDIGGRPFYVMPLVSGETIHDRLSRDGLFSIDEAIRLGRELLDAVDFAHAKSVVHRDIKPANILLDGGHAVIADFGISRALGAAGDATLTSSGVALGTPLYMSPEQLSGAGALDHRSDLYSVGCTLYEMIAGEPPFVGSDLPQLAARHAAHPVPSVRETRPDAPESLDRVLARAMAKDPAARFQSAREFSDALESVWEPRRFAGGRRTGPMRRIAGGVAVLALAVMGLVFANMRTGDRGAFAGGDVVESATTIAVLPFGVSGTEVTDFGAGIVRLVSANLDEVGAIHTVSPRSVLAAWPDHDDVDLAGSLEIARSLGARSALIGTVVGVGDEVRITAQLTDVAGPSLARVEVQGPATQLLDLVDELSLGLLRRVWRSDQAMPALRVEAISSTSFDAIRQYLRGEHAFRAGDWDGAASLFEQAVEEDPQFALAHYRLFETMAWRTPWASVQELEALETAVEHAHRLPARDRTLVQAKMLDREGRLVAVDTMRAYVARNPHDPEGWYLLGDLLHHSTSVSVIDPSDVLSAFDRSHQLAPTLARTLIHPLQLTAVLNDSTRYRQWAERLASDSPERPRFVGWQSVLWGEPDPSTETLAGLLTFRPLTFNVLMLYGAVRWSALPSDSILAGFRRALDRFDARDPDLGVLARQWAAVAAGLGRVAEVEDALDVLWAEDPDAAAVQTVEIAAVLGAAGPSLDRAEAHLMRASGADPLSPLWLAWAALSTGDRASASAHLAAARELGPLDDEIYQGLVTATDGWSSLVAGDTVPGLRRMLSGLERVGYGAPRDALWYQWEAAAARTPQFRARAIELLRGRVTGGVYASPRAMALGAALRAAGDEAGARRAFRDADRIWRGADPALAARLTAR